MTAETINDYETGKSVSLSKNDYDSVKILKNGALISFDDIQQNDVVAVMKSNDSNGIVKAVVSTYSTVSGSVKSTSKYAYPISAYIDDNGEDCYVQILTAGNSVEKHKQHFGGYQRGRRADSHCRGLSAGLSG